MKVVLNADVDKLGRKGDIVEVAPGYARNFLLPRKLALAASKGVLRQAEQMRRAREERDRRDRAAAEEVASKIATRPLRITARAGEEGQLFGSITTSDIADRLSEVLGQEVDRRKIHLEDAIRSIGVHEFSIHLHPDVDTRGSVEVVAETG